MPNRRSEIGAALAVGQRVQQIALRDVVAVDAQAARSFHDRVTVLARIENTLPTVLSPASDVAAEVDLERGLAVAEQVVDRRDPRRQVLPVVPVVLRERDVAVRHERTRAELRLREVGVEVVEAQPAVQRQPVDRPPVLHVDARARPSGRRSGSTGDARIVIWFGTPLLNR